MWASFSNLILFWKTTIEFWYEHEIFTFCVQWSVYPLLKTKKKSSDIRIGWQFKKHEFDLEDKLFSGNTKKKPEAIARNLVNKNYFAHQYLKSYWYVGSCMRKCSIRLLSTLGLAAKFKWCKTSVKYKENSDCDKTDSSIWTVNAKHWAAYHHKIFTCKALKNLFFF